MSQPDSREVTLAQVLRRQRSSILARWEERVRELPIAGQLPRAALIDHVPALLEEIAQLADQLALGLNPELSRHISQAHAWERLDLGFDLAEVVGEFAALRQVISEVLASEPMLSNPVSAAAVVDQAIDRAIAASVDRYVAARDRSLQAMDRIATAALKSRSLRELLSNLLTVFKETTAAVDSAVILLRDGNRLVVRAAVGLERELEERFSLEIGEGFSGTIAASRKSLALRDASQHPLVRSPILRARSILALYGVPLLDDTGEVIGVAHMGSRTAHEFSVQDMRLFSALASRATAAITHHLLREQLEFERNRFVELVDNLDHAIVWEADPESLLLSYASQGTRRVTGSAPAEWIGHLLEEHVPAPEWGPLRAALARCVREHEDVQWEHQLRRADGSLVSVQTGAHHLVRDGLDLLQGVSIDVTPLHEAITARDDILAVVSHDLRTPLSNIRLNAVPLAQLPESDDERTQAQRRRGQRITRAAQRMDRIIDDLQDLAALQSGHLAIQVRPQDPRVLVREAVDEWLEFAESKGIEVRAQTTAQVQQVWVDRDRILQVLHNLLSNALQVTPSGGSVSVELRSPPGELVFAVSDTGPGVPLAHRADLFDRYFRLASTPYKGTGLGLAISSGLVRAHGGRIWVEDRQAPGATFCFSVPRSDS